MDETQELGRLETACHDREISWFLAQLKSNCANIADKNLQRQGFQTFLPMDQTFLLMEEQTRQHNGKFIAARQPLFPGYIFVVFDVADRLWRRVEPTYGVTRW
ncbi:transcription termination/antitermination NusG family protein [Parasphingorhabdus sp.]|uniref:transcription termination/antitermination NusG family protein n=1 Tax=Parasphingorhabdus sp. TaxID=2709688 RepID=UPI003FA7AC9F